MMDTQITKTEFMQQIDTAWRAFQDYLGTLSEKQLTVPKDAAGWTAKDHIMHLAVWENGAEGILNHRLWYEAMHVPEEIAGTWDFDQINDVIFKENRDMPLSAVLAALQASHTALVKALEPFTIEDLKKPMREYQPGSESNYPTLEWLIASTYHHYPEHTSWIQAIVAQPEG